MLKVALIRGKYLNNFEGQNYRFNKRKIQLTAFASKYPLDAKVDFSVIRLSSLSDFEGRITKILTNRLLGDSQILFGLEKYARNFDLFHSADPHYYYSYQLAKLRQKKIISRLILTCWETLPFNNETVRRKKIIKNFTMSTADFYLTYSNLAKRCLVKEGVPLNKIKTIKLGVDLTRFKPVKHASKVLTILFVGRLINEKGILDLYSVFKRLRNCKLKIVGAGPLESVLNKLIEQDSLQHLISIDKISYREMPQVFQQSDIFVMPSKTTKTWEEQYGMALIEAMTSGLPIIAYASGAIPENLGNAGILIKESDKNSLLKQLNLLQTDTNLRAKLGKMGRDRAEKFFDSRQTALKIQALYEAINRHSG